MSQYIIFYTLILFIIAIILFIIAIMGISFLMNTYLDFKHCKNNQKEAKNKLKIK